MEAVFLKPTNSAIKNSDFGWLAPSFSTPTQFARLSFSCKFKKFVILACKDDAKVNQQDQMELEFGKMVSEDPKLTLSKIIGRNSSQDIPKLGIQILFHKKNDRMLSNDREQLSEKGVKFNRRNLSSIKRPRQPIRNAAGSSRGSVPRVILRKPSVLLEDDTVIDNLLKFKIQPNLSLTMGKGKAKDSFSDFTLVTKREPVTSSEYGKHEYFINASAIATSAVDMNSIKSESLPALASDSATLSVKSSVSTHGNDVSLGNYGQWTDSVTGLEALQRSGFGSSDKAYPSIEESEAELKEPMLHKPTRVDESVRGASNGVGDEVVVRKHKNIKGADLGDLLTSSPINEREDIDWTAAKDLMKAGQREEVELISCSTRGFVVSFGSLIGFLPYRNLAPKFKYYAFETWLRWKGLDPSMYRQGLSIIGNPEDTNKATALYSSLDLQIDHKVDQEVKSNMELEELLEIYDKEKLKFLTSFLGQKLRVHVTLADRESRKLIFSVKPKEKEELIQKKRNLMAKLNIGEVVKCCITKITYFGIFVEVEEIPAMIHQTEVSWDFTLNPSSCFKIGQIVEAKVHQLDLSLERIFLSLKEVVPDPLTEALEAVDQFSKSRELATEEADTKWTDLDNLIKELHQINGIHSVLKGPFFLSPASTPTFQVYMASMFENQYKLLARAGNNVQEVVVETSLSKEDMKTAILTCTNRAE